MFSQLPNGAEVSEKLQTEIMADSLELGCLFPPPLLLCRPAQQLRVAPEHGITEVKTEREL